MFFEWNQLINQIIIIIINDIDQPYHHHTVLWLYQDRFGFEWLPKTIKRNQTKIENQNVMMNLLNGREKSRLKIAYSYSISGAWKIGAKINYIFGQETDHYHNEIT